MIELIKSHGPTLCRMQLHNIHDSLVPTTMVTIMTNLLLIVLELYKNIAKCTLTCVIMGQIDAIVLNYFITCFSKEISKVNVTVN